MIASVGLEGWSALKDVVLAMVLSAAGSALLLLSLAVVYGIEARRWRWDPELVRNLWWLPAWKTWRFVIRNMDGRGRKRRTLRSVRYRTWLRKIEPARGGCSVDTFVDTELGSGERVLLPAGQDLPLACFRIEKKAGTTLVVITDKLGNELKRIPLEGCAQYYVMGEYAFSVPLLLGAVVSVKHVLSVPRFGATKDGGVANVFDEMTRLQRGAKEIPMRAVQENAEAISFSLP